jgi:hypothetical protein
MIADEFQSSQQQTNQKLPLPKTCQNK